jgi:hypothetical protein
VSTKALMLEEWEALVRLAYNDIFIYLTKK